MSHATGKAEDGQGIIPYPEYPLTPYKHARQWCKKIAGKLYYFGRLPDSQAALDRYLQPADTPFELRMGR